MKSPEQQKLTPPAIVARKRGERLAMMTAYDYPTARLAEEAGVDMILVGDSLGMVVLGYASTAPVTMEEMLHHGRAVARGAPLTHVTVDLPFMAYQVSDEQAVANAGRLVKEGGADSVKLEGGLAMAGRIGAIVRAGIPVVGHIGLLPQTAAGQGGLKVQGRSIERARAILADAEAVATAGAFAMVVEAVPAELGSIITERAPIPTIGIGAGPDCDGQVLVSTDVLGLEDRLSPKFAKRYAEVGSIIRDAFATYVREVRSGAFPDETHAYAMKPETAEALRRASTEG
ncbi:MAG TPA: 3-methyl-2-oxobutanoate hydroxymethyltransferase [Thermomicrobiales bacterium]|nr:3-methyl-2-oxobutanoate hydroxymethyltransferase [Thermomicrobiales bacterium]